MEASVITPGTNVSLSTGGPRGMEGITSGDFMNLLVRQLQYQDPFEPMTNQEMINQVAGIRELEMNTRLTRRLEQLTDEQRFGSAAALIGRRVSGTVTDADGRAYTLSGVVRAVRFTSSGEAMLELDTGEVLPLSRLEAVTDAA